MDKARRLTDKRLENLEKRINLVYQTAPELLRIQKTYNNYMKEVNRQTRDVYKAYKAEPPGDQRDKLKKEYETQVRDLTINNKRYKKIVTEFTKIMARVNQQALNLVNAEMIDIYTINYNQVAVKCRELGIEVNGVSEQRR